MHNEFRPEENLCHCLKWKWKWFTVYALDSNLHSYHAGEAASVDTDAIERYPEEFPNALADGGYKP